MDKLELFIEKSKIVLCNFREKGYLVYNWRDPKDNEFVKPMYLSFVPNPTNNDPEVVQKLQHYRREFPLLWMNASTVNIQKGLLGWVVRNWGGINNITDDLLKYYAEKLKPDSYQESNYLKNNVASFSKCLAFLYPKDCYVYDSRVALALNCLSHIHNLQDSIVFKQTSSKSYYTTEVSRIINKKVSRRTKRIDYFGYCRIVRRLAGLDETNDENYIKAHKLEAELFMLGGWVRDQMKPHIPPSGKDKKTKINGPTYNVLDKHLRSLF